MMKSRKSFRLSMFIKVLECFAAGIYLLKLSNKDSRARCAICLKITNKDTEKHKLKSFYCGFPIICSFVYTVSKYV